MTITDAAPAAPTRTAAAPVRREARERDTRRFSSAWSEGARTRAEELETLLTWIIEARPKEVAGDPTKDRTFRKAILVHLNAARHAVEPGPRFHLRRSGSRIERATSSLDAAEADLLQIAPLDFVLGQMPSVLNNVRRHLAPTDPRRLDIERIATGVGLIDLTGATPRVGDGPPPGQLVESDRPRIVSAMRGAASESLREQNRVRSFRNVLVVTTLAMAAVAIALGVVGWNSPTALPLCFAPEAGNQVHVVCPTQQSRSIVVTAGPGDEQLDVDDLTLEAAAQGNILLIELVGMTAAGVAAAGAIRGIRGSSEPYGVPIALALLKLPVGAITAVLGLLLMRGGFVPGLSALDTSAQIVAWAVVFGYAQQLFTRMVDQQAHTVLDSVRNGGTTAVPATIAA